MINIFDIHKEFALKILDKEDVLSDPFRQFEVWYEEAGRLHDRIQYSLDNGEWLIKRLSP